MLQTGLTSWRGPLWHIIVCRPSSDLGVGVSSEPGTYVDVRTRDHRIILYKFSQEVNWLGEKASQLWSIPVLSFIAIICGIGIFTGYASRTSACNKCCLNPQSSSNNIANCSPDLTCSAEDSLRAQECVKAASRYLYVSLTLLGIGILLRLLSAFHKKNIAAAAAEEAAKADRDTGSVGSGRRRKRD